MKSIHKQNLSLFLPCRIVFVNSAFRFNTAECFSYPRLGLPHRRTRLLQRQEHHFETFPCLLKLAWTHPQAHDQPPPELRSPA